MSIISQMYFVLIVFSFTLTLVMHVLKKNELFVLAYAFQSVILSVILAMLAFQLHEVNFLIAAALTLVIKVVLAPAFLFKRIKIHQVYYTASSYVNMPLTLAILMAIIIFAHSEVFTPIILAIGHGDISRFMPLIFSSVLISLFLMVNRKGVFSQIIGMLSLENSIVLIASFIGLRQSLAVEVGIAFDGAVWIVIAGIFVSMLYRHFGSLNVTRFKQLTED